VFLNLPYPTKSGNYKLISHFEELKEGSPLLETLRVEEERRLYG
jgi:hypothetical protein